MSKQRKLFDIKVSEIDEKDIIRGFIATANMGLCNKDEILEKSQIVEKNIDDLNSRLAELEDAAQKWERISESADSKEAYALAEEYGTEEDILARYKTLENERNQWASYLTQLEALIGEYKNFNKTLCFSNIRELLRQNSDVKIGQIEKEAGIRLGYMSRLEKEGNTAEPSMEFIVTAAKLLKVSIDTLISVDLTGLTPTEQYIVSFFDKLKSDTLKDKLDWNRETAFNLNRMESDINGWVYHPLFAEETFYEETECEYPEEVTRIVFNSKTFGPRTYICGDCFNLRLKNGTTLYLMDIEKSVHRTGDASAFAKEAWMSVPHKGCQLLVASQDDTPVAPLLEVLFSTVKERMEHPKVNNDVMYAIDSFMKDDIEDDDTDECPF
jgi:transcriptional regulator with XRE-family HTH domain